jgi:hypothetical protein
VNCYIDKRDGCYYLRFVVILYMWLILRLERRMLIFDEDSRGILGERY